MIAVINDLLVRLSPALSVLPLLFAPFSRRRMLGGLRGVFPMKDGNLRVERFHFRHGLPIAGLPILKIARDGDHDLQP